MLEAVGSVGTNKYAEGYPGRRYYGGCQVVDEIETLAIERAKELFGAEHANVQPHAGAQANMAVYLGVLDTGRHGPRAAPRPGGHLTHGHQVNFSGKLLHFVSYGVDARTERIDMDQVRSSPFEHRPKLIVAGASALPAHSTSPPSAPSPTRSARCFMVDMAHVAGLVAAGAHPSPVPHADIVTRPRTRRSRGLRGGFILCRAELGARRSIRGLPRACRAARSMHPSRPRPSASPPPAPTAFRDLPAQVVANARGAGSRRSPAAAFALVSGGTDNHLVLLNLKDSRARRPAGRGPCSHGVAITVNRNAVPFDPRPPMVTSGVRIGTPAARRCAASTSPTSARSATLIADSLTDAPDTAALRGRIEAILYRRPLYSGCMLLRKGYPMRSPTASSRLGTETAFEVLARAKALEAQGKDIIHLEIGEPDFDTPPHIVEAGVEALRDGHTHYCPAPGIPRCARPWPRTFAHARLAVDPGARRSSRRAPSRSCSSACSRPATRATR